MSERQYDDKGGRDTILEKLEDSKADVMRGIKDMEEALEAYNLAKAALESLAANIQDYADRGECRYDDVRSSFADAETFLLRLERYTQTAAMTLVPVKRRLIDLGTTESVIIEGYKRWFDKQK